MNKFWVITKEVYKKNIKSLGFIVMVLIPLIIIGFIAGMTYYFSQEAQNAEPTPIAVVTDDPALQELFSDEEWNFDIAENITDRKSVV